MVLYVRLRMFLASNVAPGGLTLKIRVYTSTFSDIFGNSENVDVYTRIFKVKPAGAKFDTKNVRNRTYRTIFWQEKKPG